ncbi:MAG: pyrimidine 5'-nucleotidase [Alphaproteobacteria bacterium]|nr:pyrimidine 5'-nucleotidase [Alphaproteobacteria bacterium]
MIASNNIENWVFDLDNTLYPASLGIIEQAREKVVVYMADLLKITHEESIHLYRELHKDYGSIMRGLKMKHNLQPKDLFETMRGLDLSHVLPDIELHKALSKLKGRKIIFTNAPQLHAETMLEKLGILEHFDHIYDIGAANYIPKPLPETYSNFLVKYNINPANSIMFEDVPMNLKPASDLGMMTVLVRNNPESFLPDCKKDYIDHIADDIAEWLHNTYME